VAKRYIGQSNSFQSKKQTVPSKSEAPSTASPLGAPSGRGSGSGKRRYRVRAARGIVILICLRQNSINDMHDAILRDDVRLNDIRHDVSLVIDHVAKSATCAHCDRFACSGGVVGLRVPGEDARTVDDVIQDEIVKICAINHRRDVVTVDGILECLIGGGEEGYGRGVVNALCDGRRENMVDEGGQVGCPGELRQRECVFRLRW